MDDMTCDAVDAVGSEVALGVASGRDRAAVLAHVQHCAACRARLCELADVSEGLVSLIPPAEPPPGFESRVMASITRPAAPRERRWHEGVGLRAAAAVVVLALVAAGSWVMGTRQHSSGPAGVATASLVAQHRQVGQVVVLGGAEPSISMAVDVGTSSVTVRCQVRLAGGGVTTVGTFHIVGGYGYWSAALPSGDSVRGAQLVTGDGHVLASAQIDLQT
jgi:predicted anti-sigma-YlaC factor YlaD